MADVFSVTASFDKSSYNTGDLMTLKITGGAVATTPSSAMIGPLTLEITAADGAKTTLAVPAVPVSGTVSTPEAVKITAVQDTSATPRNWTISEDGQSVTATA